MIAKKRFTVDAGKLGRITFDKGEEIPAQVRPYLTTEQKEMTETPERAPRTDEKGQADKKK